MPANLILIRPGEDPCLAADDLLFPNGYCYNSMTVKPLLKMEKPMLQRLTAFDINQDATLSNLEGYGLILEALDAR